MDVARNEIHANSGSFDRPTVDSKKNLHGPIAYSELGGGVCCSPTSISSYQEVRD